MDTNPAVRGRRGRPGRPRRRPDKLHADKGYDYRRCRAYLHSRGIKVRIARRGIEDKSKLGRVRWVIERTMSWLLRFKRLRAVRYDRTKRTTLPLLTLACTIINIRRLDQDHSIKHIKRALAAASTPKTGAVSGNRHDHAVPPTEVGHRRGRWHFRDGGTTSRRGFARVSPSRPVPASRSIPHVLGWTGSGAAIAPR